MVVGFYLFGLVSAVAGLYFGYCGFTMDTTVPVGDGTVANFELMNIQSQNFAFAVGFGIIASVLIGSGAIIEAVRKRQAD